MKKKSLALLTFALALTTLSFGQGFHIGAKAGANIFKVDGKSFKEEYKFGYNLGAFAEINFNDKWGIQPELLWSQTNYRTGNEFSDLYPGGKEDVEGKLNYVTIPLLLTFRPVKILSLQAGPQFGIMASQDKDLLGETKEAFKSGDFSMLGGGATEPRWPASRCTLRDRPFQHQRYRQQGQMEEPGLADLSRFCDLVILSI